jgi:hypothetical protein
MAMPYRSPFRFHAILALVLSVAGTVGVWWLLGGANSVPVWLGCWLLSVNPDYSWGAAVRPSVGWNVRDICCKGVKLVAGAHRPLTPN